MGENKLKTIGILTSGGDAPGMNAATRAVVRAAIAQGLQVKGIMRGYKGLLDEEIFDLTADSVSGIMMNGGVLNMNGGTIRGNTARATKYQNNQNVNGTGGGVLNCLRLIRGSGRNLFRLFI